MRRIVFDVDVSRRPGQTFAVLDKSFLQGITGAQLQYYVQQGWIFAIPDIFWFEHLRTWDNRRRANLAKLKSIEKTVVVIPCIGEMFRAEAKERRPASQVLPGRRVSLNPKLAAGGQFFELDRETKETAALRTAELEERLKDMIAIWRDFKVIPEFKGAKSDDMRAIVHAKSLQIRDDREDMRGFYKNHKHGTWPRPELIDEEWVFFRWIQVQLLAGLDFFASYGLGAPFKRDDLFHEIIDLEYLITALVVGGLACREKRIISRFRLLCPDGVVLS